MPTTRLRADSVGTGAVVRGGVVAQFPARHPYVDHAIAEPDRRAVVDVFDVDALVARGVTVVHLHFGFETRSADELVRWADRLRAEGIALVHTVHDLDNPHLVDQAAFHAAVGALVTRSDAVITLTRAGRDEVRRRYGVLAQVLPHPHIVDRSLLSAARNHPAPLPIPERHGVFVHASTMRPNLDIAVIGRFAPVAEVAGGLRVHVRDTAGLAQIAHLRDALGRFASAITIERRLSDHELWSRINAASCVLLPYRWGTHSGLLEAARDLHVPVLAPRFGGYCDQGATAIDEADLAGSLATAQASRPSVSPADRLRQADLLASKHREVYASLGARAS